VIYTERLASGATLLLEPVDRTDTLCIGFWFLHGSRDEAPGQRGHSHLLEHMLFKGTSKRSALSIAQEIDRVGGIINAFTEKETTCVYTIIPREHLRLAFDILTDMTVGSLLDPGEMEKEKEVIVTEIRSVDDSPEEKGHDRYLREMWGEHPLARKITGEVDEVKNAGREDVLRFAREWLVPANTIIAVAGNFDQQEARDLASAVYAAPSVMDRAARTAPRWRRKAAFVPDRFNQVQVYAGTCYGLDHQVGPYYTSLVFSTAVGESMSSRLFQKLREELALCYTVYSFRTFFSDTGLWTIYGNTSPGQTRKFLDELDRELRRLMSEPLSSPEIEDAKSHLVGSMILSREDMETRMKRLARQYLMMDRVLLFEESVASLRAVTAADIDRHARMCLRGDSFALLAYGSKEVGKLKKFDFSFAETPAAASAAPSTGGPARRAARG